MTNIGGGPLVLVVQGLQKPTDVLFVDEPGRRWHIAEIAPAGSEYASRKFGQLLRSHLEYNLWLRNPNEVDPRWPLLFWHKPTVLTPDVVQDLTRPRPVMLPDGSLVRDAVLIPDSPDNLKKVLQETGVMPLAAEFGYRVIEALVQINSEQSESRREISKI